MKEEEISAQQGQVVPLGLGGLGGLLELEALPVRQALVVKRGLAAGITTTVGGLGHALPYLIPDFMTATAIALALVFAELWAIAWIQKRWMSTPFLRAVFQVVVGGALVLAAGILIGEV